MDKTIIIKNITAAPKIWSGVYFSPSGGQRQLDSCARQRDFGEDETFLTALAQGDAVINDGSSDLSAELGRLYLQNKVLRRDRIVKFSPAVGENAPAVRVLNGATYGYEFSVGDKLYTIIHFSNIVGMSDYLDVHHHSAIDNSTADRWIKWRLHILSTGGDGDKIMTDVDQVIDSDPIEVPTTPYQIFKYVFQIPTSLLNDGRDNLFIGFERIAATGKTEPTNNPVILRVDEVHFQKIKK